MENPDTNGNMTGRLGKRPAGRCGMERSKTPTVTTSYSRPDGGYGWFIVFAIFLCLACVNGIQKANGLYFIYLMEYFGCNSSAISTVTFVQKLAEIATALIWSILAERYGSRIMVFVGASLSTVGFLLSAFSSSILLLTLSYGLICGMAFPMIVFPALQTLPRYFDKRLVFASALIFCGQSAGSILIPYLLSVVVPIYGVSGSFIIIAAINLHTFVAAALLRPCVPESIQTITVQNDPTSKPRCEKYESENDVTFPKKKCMSKRSDSHPVWSTYKCAGLEQTAHQRKSLSRTISEAVHDWDEAPRPLNLSVACLSVGSPAPAPPVAPTTPHVFDAEANAVQERPDVGVFRLIIGKYKDLLVNRMCLLLGLSTFMHSFTMSTWGTFQQAHIKDIGFGTDGNQMIVIVGSSIVELFSRLIFGVLIGQNWLKSHQWNQLACVSIAAAIFSYPFITSFPLIVVYNCFVVSIFSICVVTIMPNFSEFLGIEAAPIGQGLMVVPNGLGMVSVQIGGTLRDCLGSYTVAFYLAASALIMSAINFQIISCMSKRRVEDVESTTINGDHDIRTQVIAEEDRAYTEKVIESLQNGEIIN